MKLWSLYAKRNYKNLLKTKEILLSNVKIIYFLAFWQFPILSIVGKLSIILRQFKKVPIVICTYFLFFILFPHHVCILGNTFFQKKFKPFCPSKNGQKNARSETNFLPSGQTTLATVLNVRSRHRICQNVRKNCAVLMVPHILFVIELSLYCFFSCIFLFLASFMFFIFWSAHSGSELRKLDKNFLKDIINRIWYYTLGPCERNFTWGSEKKHWIAITMATIWLFYGKM